MPLTSYKTLTKSEPPEASTPSPAKWAHSIYLPACCVDKMRYIQKAPTRATQTPTQCNAPSTPRALSTERRRWQPGALKTEDLLRIWEPGAQPEWSQSLAPGRNREGSRQRGPPGRAKGAGARRESERRVEPFLATVLGRGPGRSRRAGSHWQVPARSLVST